MQYQIQCMNNKVDWDKIESVEINQYPWGNAYTPKTYAWLYRVEGEGFYLRMRCEESEPRAVYTEDNDPVYKDSCMEFFVNFHPEDTRLGYINFEMNSNGAILCEYGHPGDRFYLKEKNLNYPKPIVTKSEAYWEVELMISDQFIEAVYGCSTLERGHVIKGNFYKCGDDTTVPHYGSWNLINNEYPAFHKPEYFGELVIQ